jgi:hypothetical protein
MVTINQDGIVPVVPVHPRVMETHKKVRDYQQRVCGGIGTQADRNALYEQLEGWLHDLKALTLIAFRYKEQHDFLNKATNPFDSSDDCPGGATPEQQFQFANNLVMTAMRLELEVFHVYTSTLLDRIARTHPTHFGAKKAIEAKTHESFWKQVKHHPEIAYLTPELRTEANWLQGNVDWYRNRVIIHPEGFEKDGFHMKGLKSNGMRTSGSSSALALWKTASSRKSTRPARRSRSSSSTSAGTLTTSSRSSTTTAPTRFSSRTLALVRNAPSKNFPVA